MRRLLIALMVTIVFGNVACAAKEDAEATREKIKAFFASVKYQKGEVTLGKDLAKITVPADYSYVGPDDAAKILVLWGNPPSKKKPLGLLFPNNADATSTNAWVVVLEWTEDGYVKDDDADKINYDDLMKEMKKGAEAASEQRVKDGYAAIKIIGWATPPRYDKAAHKLYWAKEIQFADSPDHTLNYNIRMLGRRGVLVLNAVAEVTQLKEIEAATPQLLAMVDFNEGHRYTDFQPGSDKYASYGLAALVAGGVAAKLGMFKGLIALIIAGKKFIIIGVIALVAGLKKFYSGRKNSQPQAGSGDPSQK